MLFFYPIVRFYWPMFVEYLNMHKPFQWIIWIHYLLKNQYARVSKWPKSSGRGTDYCMLFVYLYSDFLTLRAGISIFFGLLSLCSVYLLCDKMKLHLRKYLTRQLTGLHSQPALDFKKWLNLHIIITLVEEQGYLCACIILMILLAFNLCINVEWCGYLTWILMV